VSIEYTVGGPGGDSLHLLVTPVSCGPFGGTEKCNDFYVIFRPRFLWFRAGNITLTADGLTSAPFGMVPTVLTTTAPGNITQAQGQGQGLALGLGSGPIGLTSGPRSSVAALAALLKSQAVRESALLEGHFGVFAPQATAVKAAAMWTLIYTPAENGPFNPVSRSWNFAPGPVNADWTYAVFDWVNAHLSCMPNCRVCDIYQALIQNSRIIVVPWRFAGI